MFCVYDPKDNNNNNYNYNKKQQPNNKQQQPVQENEDESLTYLYACFPKLKWFLPDSLTNILCFKVVQGRGQALLNLTVWF